jgi:hypothetical protein
VPYKIEERNGKWVVINTETKAVKGTHDSEIKAERQRRLLEGIEHGWKPTGAKAKR